MEVPAVCQNCRNFFPSGYGFDAGNTGVTVEFDLPSSLVVSKPCPVCGGQGRLLGGVYSFAGETVKLLKGPERTVSELQRLAQILGPVGQGAVAAQAAQMMARDELPAALAQIADEIANTREADERRFKIRVVIAAISLLVAAVFANNINIQDVDISIDSIFKVVVQQQPGEPEDLR